jgi:hypothetical protein
MGVAEQTLGRRAIDWGDEEEGAGGEGCLGATRGG